ncbi:putative HTH-type transcriptional regulator [Rickettsiales bacterium]|nr:putative HTH-type transcriptional regulator [Rickettsiales bacterium]
MLINNKTRYAITAVIDIAKNSQGKLPISLSKVADRQCISLGYLEQIFALLKKAEIVKAAKGPGGGYTLMKHPAQIPLLDIINATEETIEMTKCKGQKDCINGEKCITHDVWQNLNSHIMMYFKQISLVDVIQNRIPSEIN